MNPLIWARIRSLDIIVKHSIVMMKQWEEKNSLTMNMILSFTAFTSWIINEKYSGLVNECVLSETSC